MKPISQINHRYRLIRVAMRTSQVAPKTDYNYQAETLDDMGGRCVANCKPPFCAIGRDYFACEAQHDGVSEAAVFCVLMLTTILPLMNGASAVIELLRSTGGAL